MTLSASIDMPPTPPTVGRRQVMTVAAGTAALGLLGSVPARAAQAPTLPGRAELFAFPAPDTASVVFAVAVPVDAEGGRAPMGLVKIHAGAQTWSVRDSGSPMQAASLGGGALGYAGRLSAANGLHHLVAIVTPLSILPQGSIPVWAEISGPNATRLRVGNPIVAELLDRDPQLARVFHKVRPADDRALFTAALVERLISRGPTGSALPAIEHAQRLASLLLPDVLPFDPRVPVGFTFAAQNGRRPSDPVADIANCVLAGVVTAARSEGPVFHQAATFPYVQALA